MRKALRGFSIQGYCETAREKNPQEKMFEEDLNS
jgi:hypothetical protein